MGRTGGNFPRKSGACVLGLRVVPPEGPSPSSFRLTFIQPTHLALFFLFPSFPCFVAAPSLVFSPARVWTMLHRKVPTPAAAVECQSEETATTRGPIPTEWRMRRGDVGLNAPPEVAVTLFITSLARSSNPLRSR